MRTTYTKAASLWILAAFTCSAVPCRRASAEPAAPGLRVVDFFPAAVSADGSVVAGTRDSGVVRWTAATGTQDLGTLPELLVYVGGISADGAVVVGGGLEIGFGLARPFRWAASTGMTALDWGWYATAVSADGSVVAGTRDLGVVRWTLDTGIEVIPHMHHASALSADGVVMVGRRWFQDGSTEAVRWTAATGAVGIGVLPGHTSSDATGVSSDGSVVVGVSTVHAGDASEARLFRWTSAGGMTDLGVIATGLWPDLNVATSADGTVIVGNRNSPTTDLEAFVWDEARGMRPLRDVLRESGVDAGGWDLFSLEGVSGDGHTFIGRGFHPQFEGSWWIATVPEPALGALYVGASGLLLRRSRRD